MSKEIFFSDEARNGLYNGVKKLADAVKVTMGPRGRNVLIQKEHSAPHITKDGVSVAKEIELSDPLENMGAQVVKEVSANTAEEAGDGTTTATVLAHAIFKEGLRNITAGANPVEVKRGMDKAVTAVIENLKTSSRPVTDKSEIAQVATISANSDFTIGNLIADAMERVGNDGVITVEEAKGMQDELEVVEGMQFDRGYLSPYFINNQEKNNVEMANPFVLITDKKIASLKDILPVLESTQKAGKPLVIIAEDVEGEALSSLVVNKLQGVLNVAAVKAPGFGDNRVETLKDIAVLTGGTLIASDLNMDLSKVTMDMLGTCGRIVIDKEDTTIVEGHGDPETVTARVAELKSQSDAAVSAHDKETLSKRISKLSGGVAVIKVGAASETEMKEKKDRVDDALAATKAAVEEGIVIGGGAALIKASSIDVELEGDQAIGVTIIKHAVTAPIKQIADNAGYDSGVVVRDVFNDKPDYGFNAATGEHVDMFDAGIIDPLKVVRVALQNAVSVSSLLLTTEATVTIEKDDNQTPVMNPPMY